MPRCELRCSGSNGCGGTCDASNCTAQSLVCQDGSCVAPAGALYDACDAAKPTCGAGLVCAQVGPAGPHCYTVFCAVPLRPAGSVCLMPCPLADAGKASASCPAKASFCYVEGDATTGYCVPKD